MVVFTRENRGGSAREEEEEELVVFTHEKEEVVVVFTGEPRGGSAQHATRATPSKGEGEVFLLYSRSSRGTHSTRNTRNTDPNHGSIRGWEEVVVSDRENRGRSAQQATRATSQGGGGGGGGDWVCATGSEGVCNWF